MSVVVVAAVVAADVAADVTVAAVAAVADPSALAVDYGLHPLCLCLSQLE